MLGRLALIALLATSLSACGVARNVGSSIGLGQGASNRTTVEDDGVRYRAKTSADRDDRRNFSVTVTPVSADPEGALNAGEYQATRYCLLTFGGSDKEWTIGPDTPLDQLPVDGNTLTMQGRCTQR